MSEVASRGEIQVINMSNPQVQPAATNQENIAPQEGQSDPLQDNGEPINNGNTNEKPSLSDDQLREYFKANNIPFESLDALKNQLTPKSAEPTDEEKAAKVAAFEKRMLDKHVASGKTIEQFSGTKAMMNADLAEFSRNQFKKELLDSGVADSEEDAKSLSDQMFLQQKIDDLEPLDDETDEQYTARKEKLQKRLDFGAKELANRGLSIKETATNYWQSLKQAVEQDDEDAKAEAAYSTQVEDHVKAMERKLSFQLNQVNNKDIEPVVYDAPEEAITQVKELLSNPVKRNEFFFDENGELNLKNIAPLLLRDKAMDAVVKKAAEHGGKIQAQIFHSRFPINSVHALGVGGAAKKSGEAGAAVKRGEPTRFSPQQQN